MTDLHALLGDHMPAVYAAAAAIHETIPGCSARAAEHAAVNALAAVLPDLLAAAWDEGHETPWKREPDDCRCGAWSSIECGCGHYGTGRIITPNPYRCGTEEADRAGREGDQ